MQEERDKLLAEKTSWEKQHTSTPADSSTADEAKSAWETEKTSLLQARDEALAKLKVCWSSLSRVNHLFYVIDCERGSCESS